MRTPRASLTRQIALMTLTSLTALTFLACKGDEPASAIASAPAQAAGAAAQDPSRAPAQVADRAPSADSPRYVVLGSALTETVFALGHGGAVVGVDSTSAWPEQARALPQLGYLRKISAESVLSLSPTHIIAAEGAGPPSAIDQLRGAQGLTLTIVPGGDSVQDAKARILTVGQLLDAQDAAADLVAAMDAKLHEVKLAQAADPSTMPRALFIYARGAKILMVAGRDTPAHTMLTLAGAKNAAESLEGFKPLTPEAVIQAAPEVIVMPSEGAQSIGGEQGVFSLPGLAQTPAGQRRALILVDDVKLLGFGPRLGEAVAELHQRLRQSAQAPQEATP